MLRKKIKIKSYFELPIIKHITIKDNNLPPKDAFTAQDKNPRMGFL